jgi:hypothetical protein
MERNMTNKTEDPRFAALRSDLQERLGDKLMERGVKAAMERCEARGISQASLMEAGMTRANGGALVESVAVDGLIAQDDDNRKGEAYEEWRKRKFPNHMRYRGAR